MNDVLENDRIRAEIDPTLGARLHQLTIDGLDLLGPDGSFPMVPWAGRIRDGKLNVDGSTYELPRSSDGNAIHGLGRKVEWERVGDGAYRRHLGDPWPSEGTAELRYVLWEDGLRVELTWDDGTELPCSIGLHPWFNRRLSVGDDVQISLDIDEMVERGDDGLPTGHLVAPKAEPWDDCFRLGSSPVVTWPGALELTLTASTPWWVVFTEREHLFCVEPQTVPPDAFDHPSLQPDGSWPRSITFDITARAL